MTIYSVSFRCDGIDVIDPQYLLTYFQQRNLSTEHFSGLANSVRVPVGKAATRAYVLVSRGNISTILANHAAGSLAAVGYTVSITLYDGVLGTRTIAALAPISAQSILSSDDTAGPSNDPDDVYLLELADARYTAHYSAVNKAYNLTLPEHDGTIYTNTSDGGTPWTWTTLLQDLWSSLPTSMGAINLAGASLPSEYPTEYDFQGWNAWDAIHQVLADIQHHIVSDLDGTFSIEPDSATTAGLATAITALQTSGRVVDRSHYLDGIILPATVRVFFPRKDDAFQLSATADARTSKEYWCSRAFYTVDVATTSIIPGAVTVANGVQTLHSSKQAEYTTAGVLSNSGDLNTAATSLATLYLNSLDKDRYEESFQGYADFSPRGSLSGVFWHDLGRGAETVIYYQDPADRVTSPVSSSAPARSRSNNALSQREGPGPADQSRQHLPPDYLILVELTGVLNAGYSAPAAIQYGTVGGGGISLSDSHAVVVYEVNGLTYPIGTVLFAYFHPQTRKWIVWPWSPGTEGDLRLVQSNYCFTPGDVDYFSLWEWNGSAWVDTGTDVEVVDLGKWNFLLPGEFAWARYYPNGNRYQLVGSHGLHRTAKITQHDIDCYARGHAKIHYWTAYANCTSGESDCEVEVCNKWAFPRDVRQNEEVFIQFYEEEWLIISGRRALMAYAELYQDMCPTDYLDIAVQNARYLDGCADDEWSGVVRNTYSLAGLNGDRLFLVYDSEEGCWHIVQVQHHQENVAVEDEAEGKFLLFDETGGSGGGCAILGNVQKKVALMYCDEQEWKIQIPLFDLTLISDVSSIVVDGCPQLTYSSTRICSFTGGDPAGSGAFFAFSQVALVTDIYDDGTCVWAEYQAICVGGAVAGFDLEMVLCGSDCEGSGSGSGSGIT